MTVPCFIDGAPVHTQRSFDDINPATGKAIKGVCEASSDDVDRAVAAANRASLAMRRMSPRARADMLDAIANGIDARRDDFVRAEIEDTGKPISLASALDIPRGAANFRSFATQLRALADESFHTTLDDGTSALNLVVREPLGTIGVICPWNLPLLLMTWKVAPAMAAGNAVVVKPSEETPQTATLLGEVMKSVGVPDGAYNVVHGFGPGSAGEFLVTHPNVDAITFTGESKTGTHIMAAAAPTLKRVSFELGGKNAAIVFDDCDLDSAALGVVRSTFMNTGQVCLCTERIYVQRGVYDAFVERLSTGAKARVFGDPFSTSTTMGPLISAVHRDKVLNAYNSGRSLELICGGTAAHNDAVPDEFRSGFWVEPTIWASTDTSHALLRDEVFGPCAVVVPFDDEDEAIHHANATDYGLCASVWTQNLDRAHRVSRAVDVGLVWVNTWYLRDLRTPFGGMKRSGIGREGGRWSFDFYGEPKNICIKL